MVRRVVSLSSLIVLAGLAGCGMVQAPGGAAGTGSTTIPIGTPSTVKAMGAVHGGQFPITGATIQLYAVGTTGYGLGATALITPTLTTSDGTSAMNSNANAGNANNTLAAGSFTISSQYTCPASDPMVYLTATGGNPGLTAGTNNSAITLVAALTDCNTLKTNAATTFISINEVTTVAAAYALNPFINFTTGAIGSYGYANTGLVNGFATATSLANTSTGAGQTATQNGNGTTQLAKLYTLANILVPCVNTSGPTSGACNSLFTDVTPSGGTTPTTVLGAILDIARNPGNNVPNIYGLSTANANFQTALSSRPNDFTVAISYNNKNYTGTRSVAIDAGGNVWTANYNTGGSASAVGKMTPVGVPQTVTQFGITGADALAIDTLNNVWVVGLDDGELLGYNNNGNSFAGPLSGYSSPKGVAIDISGNLWITNFGNSSVTETHLNYSGGSGIFSNTNTYTVGGLNAPTGIAFDTAGNAWIANATTVTGLDNSGAALSGSPFSGTGINSPAGIAVDGSNHVWLTNTGQTDLAELNNSGTVISPTGGYTLGGIAASTAIAVDGGGNIWSANSSANSLSEVTSAGAAVSPNTGYTAGSLNGPTSLAIDGSGNVWVANGSSTGSLTEFVGAAVPAITPIASALQSGQIGVEPGTPIPVVITSSALPYYTAGSFASIQLHASGGNSGGFTWSSTSTFPTGLTLSSVGLISGTTSVTGNSTVLVQACDSQNLTNCISKSFTLSSTSALAALGSESALNGTYAFRYSGFRNGSSQGAVYGAMYVGSFTANGSGAITGGEVDSMSPNATSISSQTGLTGSYAVGPDGRGTLLIGSGSGGVQFSITVGNFSGPVAQTIHVIRFDDTEATTGGAGDDIGAGIGKLQTAAAFVPATLNASFAFGFEGESPCTNYNSTNPSCAQTIAPFGPVSAVGYFAANGSGTITAGEEDATAVGTNYTAVSLSGSYTNPDTSGRGTITLTPGGTLYPAAPTHFVYYIVNTGEMFMLSTDGHATNTMLSGDVLTRTPSVFTGANPLSGAFVGYTSSSDNGDGVSLLPTASDANLFLLTASGTQFTIVSDQNNAGSLQLNQTLGTLAYSVDSNGRMTLASGGGSSPVFYLANLAQGFATIVASGSSSTDNPGLLTLQQQSGGPFSAANITGTYAYGDIAPPLQDSVNVGVFTSAGTGSGSSTYNGSSNNGVLTTGQTNTSTLSVASNGRAVLTTSGGSSIIYIISPGNAVLITTSTTSTAPTVTYSQK